MSLIHSNKTFFAGDFEPFGYWIRAGEDIEIADNDLAKLKARISQGEVIVLDPITGKGASKNVVLGLSGEDHSRLLFNKGIAQLAAREDHLHHPENILAALDAASSPSQENPFVVTTEIIALQLQPSSLPNGQVGTPYSVNLSVSNGTAPFLFILANGPEYFQVTPEGVLSANFSETGIAPPLLILVFDSKSRIGWKQYTVTVTGQPLQLLGDTFPMGYVGQSYDIGGFVQGGVPPYTLTFNGGTPPPGLELAFLGGVWKLAGTPSQAGSFSFVIKAVDSVQTSVEKTYSMTVQ